jgi:glycosyltransferase involved in cell wall biosynthesis
MRIAVWYHLPSGGGKRAVRDQVLGLLARGHHVEVWMPSTADRAFLPLPPSVTQHVLPLPWQAPGLGRWDRWRRPADFVRRLRLIRSHARQVADDVVGFDLLLAHGCMWFAAPHVARTSPIPCAVYLQEPFRILHEAGDAAPLWCGPVTGHARKSRLGRCHEVLEYWRDLWWQRAQVREEWRNARAATTLLVNSWFSAESAMRVYGRRATVCEPGIDMNFWTDRGRERVPLVVGVGTVAPHKGVADAVEVVAALEPSLRSGVRFQWFGNAAVPGYAEQVTRQARDLGVQFELQINVPEEDIRSSLQQATAFLYPSRLEPFGYAPLEAAACGCPTVGVREGGPRETMIDGVTACLTDGTIRAMAAALTCLLRDPVRARAMGAAARDRVGEHYSLPASIDRLEAALLRTVGLR